MRKNVCKLVVGGIAAMSLVAAMGLAGCGSSDNGQAAEPEAEAVELQIFAANSLEKALPEVQALYTEQHPEVTFADTQFKASGDLVEELAGGASADALICASTSSMDKAAENSSIDEATRADMFVNDLVLCAAEDSDITVNGIEDLGTDAISTFAMGEPNAVPAGKYAAQTLESAGLATIEEAEDKTVTVTFADSVASKVNAGADKVGTVAQYVSQGEAEVGFVYSSDIFRYDGIKVVYTVPSDMHKNIVYPGAVVAGSANAQAAADFLTFCMTDPDAQAIFSQYGFELAAE